MRNTKYEATINLHHDEQPAKVNSDGELTILDVPKSRVHSGLGDPSYAKYNDQNKTWQRCYTAAWKLLETQTTERELLVAHKLAVRAKAYTNSLEPISPESTAIELATELGIDRRKIMLVIDRLFKLGVIGKFEVCDRDEHYKKYYVFNPYLAFNGGIIKKDVSTLFDNTYYALV